MFANQLNRIENSLQRGLNDIKNVQVLKLLQNDRTEKYPFRRLAYPVFRTHTHEDEPTLCDVPPQEQTQDHIQAPIPAALPIDDLPLANRMIGMEWQRRQQRLVSHINGSQPSGCHVMAYHILPTELFVGEIGRFLMLACDFYSHSFANTLLLPVMLAGVDYFQLPQHPQATLDAQLFEAKARVSQLRNRVANEHNRVAAALARGDVGLLFKKNANRPDYKQELTGICRSIAINTLGLSTYVTHESRFGNELREAGG